MEHRTSELHPDLQHMRSIPQFSYNRWNLWLIRLLTRLQRNPKIPDSINIQNIDIPGFGNTSRIQLRIYTPGSLKTPAPALLWIHGGGYIIGNPKMDDYNCSFFATELGIMVFYVDYRLAPEYPFPIPLEDCYSALAWMSSADGEFNIDPNRLAIAGESAGAGLAASLAQLAYDRGDIRPIFQLLIYPMLDDRSAVRGDLRQKKYKAWDQKSNRFGWESYLGTECGLENLPPYAVPSRREDLSGLPPAWIGVGTLDLFHDEVIEYAQRLTNSNVDCELVVVPGAFHSFDVFAPRAPIVRDFQKSQIAASKKYLTPSNR